MRVQSVAVVDQGTGWLTFEVLGHRYALPTDSVLEVMKVDRVDIVPGIAMEVTQVINWKGEPLPLIAMETLLDGTSGSGDRNARHNGKAGETVDRPVMVVTDKLKPSLQIGFSVGRVLGLASIISPAEGDVETLDPGRLLVRAGRRIESAVSRERWALA
jgi:chemotaxis signal transduction protein